MLLIWNSFGLLSPISATWNSFLVFPYWEGHCDFRFWGIGYFFKSVSRFLCQKTLVFISVCGFSVFRIWFSLFVKTTEWFSIFPDWVPVTLRSERQLCASTDLEQLWNLCTLEISVYSTCHHCIGSIDNWDVKSYRFWRFWMRFSFWSNFLAVLRYKWFFLRWVLWFLIDLNVPLLIVFTYTSAFIQPHLEGCVCSVNRQVISIWMLWITSILRRFDIFFFVLGERTATVSEVHD